MASPVPLLRTPVPGGRSQSGTRTPRLTLGIPPSPSARPVTGDGQLPLEIPQFSLGGRPTAPKLSIATPMGSHTSVPEMGPSLRLQTQPPLHVSTMNGTSDTSRSRADSFQNASVPGSASSSTYSALSFAQYAGGRQMGTPDPSSAISSVY